MYDYNEDATELEKCRKKKKKAEEKRKNQISFKIEMKLRRRSISGLYIFTFISIFMNPSMFFFFQVVKAVLLLLIQGRCSFSFGDNDCEFTMFV